MLKDIEKDGEVTVLALQVGTKNAEGDTLITSDYAAVKAREVKNIVLPMQQKDIKLQRYIL